MREQADGGKDQSDSGRCGEPAVALKQAHPRLILWERIGDNEDRLWGKGYFRYTWAKAQFLFCASNAALKGRSSTVAPAEMFWTQMF